VRPSLGFIPLLELPWEEEDQDTVRILFECDIIEARLQTVFTLRGGELFIYSDGLLILSLFYHHKPQITCAFAGYSGLALIKSGLGIKVLGARCARSERGWIGAFVYWIWNGTMGR
jgi:hypothetical protein